MVCGHGIYFLIGKWTVKAKNITVDKMVAVNVIVASGIFARIKGLIGRKSLPQGEALLLDPCNGIHTFGMRFPIDVLFLDRNNAVVAIRKNLVPNRITPLFFAAKSTLELPAGIVEATATKAGDEIEIS
jgi:uncharacterized membrane protein (UPF0127 family)